MTPEQFTYWLQGFFELSGDTLSKREQLIKDHLKTTFHKVTPDRNTGLLGTGPLNPPYPYKDNNLLPSPNYSNPNIIC